MQTNVDDLLFQAILQPRYIDSVAKRPKQHSSGATATFVYEKVAQTLTIEYLDEQGKAIPGHPATTKELMPGEAYSD